MARPELVLVVTLTSEMVAEPELNAQLMPTVVTVPLTDTAPDSTQVDPSSKE